MSLNQLQHCRRFYYFNDFKLLLLLFYVSILFQLVLGDITVISSTSTSFLDGEDTTADLIKEGLVAEAEPAVWGDPAPDYSKVTLTDKSPIYLYCLIYVDVKITRHYSGNLTIIKKEILRMVSAANDFFGQLNIRVSVVDVLQTMRDDLSLYAFERYHNERLRELPYHDFSALISYRYAGGLAYVGALSECNTPRNVMLCGFYPQFPEAMGAIFFHETAHLLGVPHDQKNDSLILDISNCICNDKIASQEIYGAKDYKSSRGCLKIPGFDHDCTAQYLANVINRNRCLSKHPRSNTQNIADGYLDWSPFFDPNLSICGNGVVEGEESCDCGMEKFCDDWNCIPGKCERKISHYIIYLVGITIGCVFLAVLFLFCYCLISCCSSDMQGQKWRICKVATRPVSFFKRLFISRTTKTRTPRNISGPISQREKVAIIQGTPYDIAQMESNATRPSIARPRIAPPPPPTPSLAAVKAKPPARPPPPKFGHPNTPPPPPPPQKLLTPCPLPVIPPLHLEAAFGDHEEAVRTRDCLVSHPIEEDITYKFEDFSDDD